MINPDRRCLFVWPLLLLAACPGDAVHKDLRRGDVTTPRYDVPRSGEATSPCSRATCPNGCCQRTACINPPNDNACGKDGIVCTNCAATKATCSNGTCQGGVACSASNCSGCCDSTGCVTSTSDIKCGKSGAPCENCTGSGKTCSAGVCGSGTGCSFDVGCNDNTKFCDVGKCVPCPAGTFNCNGQGQCECQGGCNGAVCTGATSCDYYDKNVCGGDNTKWCWQNACTSCSGGFFNCNGTMGCECDSKGCNGIACAGACSGGECP